MSTAVDRAIVVQVAVNGAAERGLLQLGEVVARAGLVLAEDDIDGIELRRSADHRAIGINDADGASRRAGTCHPFLDHGDPR